MLVATNTASGIVPDSTSDPADIHVLDAIKRELSRGEATAMEARVRLALERFPELEGCTVTVGRIKPSNQYPGSDPIATANPWNRMVNFGTDRAPSNLTVYHELAHLAVHERNNQGDDLPHTSEEFTSIYAVAKMDWVDIDRDHIAYLGEPSVPREEWPSICRRALEYREEHRNYIQKAREWLEVGP